MENKEPIYIIGAGVSGLIAAYELDQKGFKTVVIEQTDAVGGRVKTIREQDYALDLGFQVLLSAYPLANKYLDMEALQLQKLESGALIYVDGKSFKIGDPLRNLTMLFPTLLADIGSVADKFKIFKLNRALKQKSIKAIFDTKETTTRQYLLNYGFSEKIIDRFFKPFFSGIFLEPNLETSSRMFEFVYKMFGDGYATIPKLGIGEISKQLKNKLQNTEFIYNTEVKEVTNEYISMQSGKKIAHNGVIVTSNASALIPSLKVQDKSWKSCVCLYFEVDKTNIPKNTIALIADEGCYTNNLYAYKDANTGKTILSGTVVKQTDLQDESLVEKIANEIKKYTGAQEVNFIKLFKIKKALPDIKNLKMTISKLDITVMDNVVIAGDTLLNGSLNAAMESGRLAAETIIEKR